MTDSREAVGIEVENVGPITEFAYQMAEPGLHVLTGRQGAGKTTILRTVQLATDGRTDEKPTKRDGTKRGEATVAGKTLKIARAVREEGELTIAGMGDLNIATLHDPGHKTAQTRDKYRIAALVRLAGVTPDIVAFKGLGLTESEWVEWVDEVAAANADDLVEMAARVKRDIDRFGKHLESQQATAEQAAAARIELYEGEDTTGEHDESALQDALESAWQAQAKIEQRTTEASANAAEIANAREMIEAAEAGYTGPGSEAAEADQVRCNQALKIAKDECDRLSAELTLAQESLGRATIAADTSAAEFKAAARHEQTIEDWRATVDRVTAVAPTEAEAVEADTALVAARDASESGSRIRAAIAARAAADDLTATAKDHRRHAEKIREAAKSTQDVLTEAIGQIANCPLRVVINEDGDARLVITTERDDNEPFDQLSDGEKWRTIVPICCDEGRLVVLPQGAFGELSGSTRSLLDVLARQAGCFLLTAQADDGPLIGAPYEPATEAAAV